KEKLWTSSGFSARGWSFLHIRVKDRLPLSLLFLPDGSGVVGTGLALPIVCAFEGHLVGRDTCVRASGRGFVIADRERFHVPLLHVRHFLLHVGHAFGIDSHKLCGDDFLEVVGFFVLKRLPGRFLFLLHCVVVCRGGRNGNGCQQRDHCVPDHSFHGVLSLKLSNSITLMYSSRGSRPIKKIGALNSATAYERSH